MRWHTIPAVFLSLFLALPSRAGSRRPTSRPEDREEAGGPAPESVSEAVELFQQAQLEHRQGREDPAIDNLIQALRKDPHFAPAYSLLGGIFTAREDYKRALAAYSKAIENNPNSVEDFVGRAKIYQKTNNPEAAIKDLGQAVSLAPDQPGPLYSRGDAYWQWGDRQKALEDYLKSVRFEITDVSAGKRVAERLEEGNKPSEALDLYTKLLKNLESEPYKDLNSLRHDLLLRRGRLYAALQKPEKAEKDFDALVRLFPNSAAAWTERGKYYFQTSDLDKASSAIESALRLDPKYVLALIVHGKILSSNGKTQEAIAEFDSALALDPSSAEVYGSRGSLHLRAGNLAKAVSDFNQAIKLAPQDPQWRLQTAMLQMKLRRYNESLESLNQFLSSSTADSSVIYGLRAQVLAILGERVKALEDIESAIRADPKSVEPYLQSSGIHVRAWEPSLAIKDLSIAENLNPKSFALRFNMGVAYGMLGQMSRSIREFKRAVSLEPKSASALTALCRAYRLDGSYRAAERECRAALAADPNYPLAYIDRGLTLLALKDFEGAANDLLEGYRLGAHYPGAELGRSVAHAALRQYAESDAAYQSAMELDPWAQYTEVGFAPKDRSGAGYKSWIESLEKSIRRDSTEPASHLVLGNAWASDEAFEKAIAEYSKAAELEGALTAAYLDRSQMLRALGRLNLAEEDCRRAIALDPKSVRARVWLLEIMALGGQHRKGLQEAAEALKILPGTAAIFVRAGNIRYFMKDIEFAEQNYRLALRPEPESAEAYNGVGLCELSRSKARDAIENFSRAISINPRNPHYFSNRAASYVNVGSFANASSDYRAALRVNTDPKAETAYRRLFERSLARAKGERASSSGQENKK